MRDYQRRAFSLLTTAIFLLAWFQCGGPVGAEKQVCFHDITLDISNNPGNEASEPFLEMGLFPCHYKIASLEPGLLLGSSFRKLNPPDFHCINCESRAPPACFQYGS